jgi:2-polyprenyl-6-methoxyphenol hydroxylase-like FAD-dependent oxidoreductase
VLRASIAGLLAARVLSESFSKVTVFDRDELPTQAAPRKGVPQSEHPHGLLARGRQALEQLFPGFTADLTAIGALPVDLQRDLSWINDGHPIPRVTSGIDGLCVSRATLEHYIRQRVSTISNVDIAARHEAVGLNTDDGRQRVTAVRVLPLGGTERLVVADVVIDATGRGNRGPTWLGQIGYAAPREDHIDAATTYMTREYRRNGGDADFDGIVIGPSPETPYGAVALATEGGRWMVTLIGVGADNAPPQDPAAYLEFTRKLPTPSVYDLLSRSQPLTEPRKMRLPTSVRRRYERLDRLPEGFLAVGDALCSFNPAYGQGMTVAAVEAIVLRQCLRAGRDRLGPRFFAKAAKVVDVPWDITVGADLRYPQVQGTRTAKVNILNAYIARLHIAAEHQPLVGTAFLSVANLMTPPTALLRPGILARVLWSGRRGRIRTTSRASTSGPDLRARELIG